MGGFNPISTVFDATKMMGTALDSTKGLRNLYGDARSLAVQNAIMRDTIAASEQDAHEKATLERRRNLLTLRNASRNQRDTFINNLDRYF